MVPTGYAKTRLVLDLWNTPPGYIGWWLVPDLVRLKAYRWTFNRFCQLAQAVDQAQLLFGLNLAQTNLCSSHRPR